MSDEKPMESTNPSAEDLTMRKKPGEKQLKEEELNKVSGSLTSTSRSDGGGSTVGRAN